MRRIISALLISISTTVVLAQGAKPIELADGAPDRHIVTSGDTLWGIAALAAALFVLWRLVGQRFWSRAS